MSDPNAYEVPGFKLGVIVAGADLTAKQYRFTKVNAVAEIVTCATPGEHSVGILQNKPASGVPAELDSTGVSLLVLGDDVSPNDVIATDANGAGVPAGAGDIGLAIALSSGSAGQIAPVLQKAIGKV